MYELFLKKTKKGITATNAFQKFLRQSGRRVTKPEGSKPKKICVGKSSEFYEK